MTEKIIEITKGMVKADFNFWVGKYLDRFYDGLAEKKIIGNKCSKCGDVFVPPRKICGKCNFKIDVDKDYIDLPDTGILKNYTLTPYKVNDRGDRNIKKNTAVGMVQIDGSNTAIVYRLLAMKPEEIKIGMKVKIEWNDKVKGDPADIKGFAKV